jgi:ribonuclease P protein component
LGRLDVVLVTHRRLKNRMIHGTADSTIGPKREATIPARLTAPDAPGNIMPSPDRLFASNARGVHVQENVSAQQEPPEKSPRIPRADEHREGAPGAQAPSRQRPEEIDSLKVTQPEKFTRDDRLHHSREFEAVYSQGIRIPGRHFVLFILPNKLGRSRLGVTLSRKVGNAVVRNQARRRIRDIFRRRRDLLAAGFDVVVHTRPEIARQPRALLEMKFEEAVTKFERLGKGTK